jgi:hypothetical protein
MDLGIPHLDVNPQIYREFYPENSEPLGPWDRKGTASDSDSSELLFGSGALQNITRMDISTHQQHLYQKKMSYILYIDIY